MSIMPRDSEAVKYQRAMAKGSDFQPEFLVATATTPDEARTLAEQLRALDTVARVDSVSDLIPDRQAEKMERLGKLSAILGGISLPPQADPVASEGWITAFEAVMEWLEDGQDKAFTVGHKDVVGRLETLYGRFEKLVSRIQGDPAAVQRLNDLQNAWFKVAHDWSQRMDAWWQLSPVVATSLPEGLMERFRGEDGALAVYMFPKDSIYDMDFLDRFLSQVYPLAPEAIGFPSTHQVFSRMVLEGFKRASALAVLAVLLLLFIEFRSVKWTLIAFLPLLFGGAWMFGILRLMGQSLNYTNVIALPLVIGMAVDYGVYLAHRLMEHRSDDPWSTIRRFGGPVALAALTTLAGISALVMGIHQGVATLGEALVIGIVSCLLAAVLVLPCLLGFAGVKTGDRLVAPRGDNPKDAGVAA
jgi:hypothetical protein